MSRNIEDALKEIIEENYSKKVPENWNIQYSGNTQLQFSNSDSVKSRVENILSHKNDVDIYGLNFKVNGKEVTVDDSGVK